MILMLDDFLFEEFEIPDKIPISGKQTLAVHKLIGGNRVIDAMGPDPDEIRWSGRFQGGDVVSRARELEVMRDSGQPVQFLCGSIAKTVLVSEFKFDFERPYQAPYEICCTVLPDDADDTDPSLDDLVSSDMTNAGSSLGQ